MQQTAILRASKLLSSFTDVGIKILASISELEELSPGESLFRQGQVADKMWFIGSGEASILLDQEDGNSLSVGKVGSGESVGDVALLSAGGRRMVTLIASSDLKAVTIERSALSSLQKKKPQACLKLLMLISRQLGVRLSEDGDALRRLLSASVRQP